MPSHKVLTRQGINAMSGKIICPQFAFSRFLQSSIMSAIDKRQNWRRVGRGHGLSISFERVIAYGTVIRCHLSVISFAQPRPGGW